MANYVGEIFVGDWTNLTPLNGWVQKAGAAPLSYRVIGFKVELRGTITPPGILAGNLVMFTLPTALWPPYSYNFMTAGLTLAGISLGCVVAVGTDGNCALTGVSALGEISLTDIDYTILA